MLRPQSARGERRGKEREGMSRERREGKEGISERVGSMMRMGDYILFSSYKSTCLARRHDNIDSPSLDTCTLVLGISLSCPLPPRQMRALSRAAGLLYNASFRAPLSRSRREFGTKVNNK
jgi:hypothetical protein